MTEVLASSSALALVATEPTDTDGEFHAIDLVYLGPGKALVKEVDIKLAWGDPGATEAVTARRNLVEHLTPDAPLRVFDMGILESLRSGPSKGNWPRWRQVRADIKLTAKVAAAHGESVTTTVRVDDADGTLRIRAGAARPLPRLSNW